jgi:hypothetical protein
MIPSLLVMLFVVSLVFVTLMQVAVIHSNRNKLLGYSKDNSRVFPEPSSLLQVSDDNSSRTSSSRVILTASGARFSREEVLKALNYSELQSMSLHPRVLKGISVSKSSSPPSSSLPNKGKKDMLRIEAMLDRSLPSRDQNIKMLQNFVNSGRIKQIIRSLQQDGMLDVPVSPQHDHHPSSLSSKASSFHYDYHNNDAEFQDGRDEHQSETQNELLSWHAMNPQDYERASRLTSSQQPNKHDQIINSYGAIDSHFGEKNAIMPLKERHNESELQRDSKQEKRPQDVIQEYEEGQHRNPQVFESLDEEVVSKSSYDSRTNNRSEYEKGISTDYHRHGHHESLQERDGTHGLLVVKGDSSVNSILAEPQVISRGKSKERGNEVLSIRTGKDGEGIIGDNNEGSGSRRGEVDEKKINSQGDSRQETSRGSDLTSKTTFTNGSRHHQDHNHQKSTEHQLLSPLNDSHSRGKEDSSYSLLAERNYKSLINLQNMTRNSFPQNEASNAEQPSNHVEARNSGKENEPKSHEVSVYDQPSIQQLKKEKSLREEEKSFHDRLYDKSRVIRPHDSVGQASQNGSPLLLDDKIFSSNKSLCPLVPTSLMGRIQIELQPEIGQEMEHIIQMNPQVKVGGSFSPSSCYSRHRVAIIIPYRDRLEHLQLLLYHLHPVLQRQQLEYTLYVVEQAGNDIFNKGVLMNAGAREALKDNDFHCFIFHDVDLIPEDDRNLYSCPSAPRHMSYGVDKFNYT